MRFITFAKDGVETVGIRIDHELVDLSIAAPRLPRTLVGLIETDNLREAGAAAKNAGSDARRSLEGLKYLPVIPRPPKIFGFGRNYGSHTGERPATPGFFLSSHTRLAAHNESLIVPKISKTFDYEAEVAIIIGIGGKYIAARDALNHIAGYTVFNDGSVRGLMTHPTTLSLMKNCDKTGPLGPEMVSPDELPAGAEGLRVQLRRNGVTSQNDTTSSMFWKVPEIIEIASRYQSLEAGDVVITGTPGGTIVDRNRGVDMNDPSLPYLKDGEIIETEVEGIGILRNPIVEER